MRIEQWLVERSCCRYGSAVATQGRGDRSAQAIRRALGRLSTLIQMLILAFAFLVAIGLLWLSSKTHGDVRTSLQAFATGVFVSVSFGFVQSAFTGHITVDILRQDLLTSLEAVYKSFLPTREFPGSEKPNDEFNKLLDDDLSGSSLYWFRGVSARFTADRLIRNKNRNLQVKLILPDLTVDGSLSARATYLMQNQIGEGASGNHDETVASIRRTVEVGIVGLIEARLHCASIELILVANPSLDRIEVFADAVWITLFSSAEAGQTYPPAVRLRKDSALYAMQATECSQIAAGTNRRILIPANCSISTACDLLSRVVGDAIDQTKYQELRAEFHRYREKLNRSRRKAPHAQVSR